VSFDSSPLHGGANEKTIDAERDQHGTHCRGYQKIYTEIVWIWYAFILTYYYEVISAYPNGRDVIYIYVLL
jgi:hypothetical protein